MIYFFKCATALLVFSVLTLKVCLGEISRKSVTAVYSPGPVIDGELEELWFQAEPATGFTLIMPNQGDPPSHQTKIYLLYSDDALFVAFHCLDSSPDSITGKIRRRDQGEEADVVYIQIDTFHDKRNAYFFGLTAAGIQLDGNFTRENRVDYSWDGVWESATAHRDDGWVAEMRLPFNSFRHGGARHDGWGINFDRVIHRTNEWFAWQPVDRDRGMSVSEFGLLKGLEGINKTMHVEILPHVTGRWDQPAAGEWGSRNEWENLGVDLKIVPSSSWTVDLTVEPDFAQVDVDQEVINLSDYPVYLSEKRPFFLEGLGLFDETIFRMFYTRKITNPDLGARITGQHGKMRMSVLSARNITTENEQQSINAGRAVWNVGERSTFGFTGTSLVEDNFHSNAGAVDTRLRWGAANSLNLMYAGVDRTNTENQPFGASWNVYMEGKHIRGESGGTYKGQDFEINDLGFVGYSNVVNNWNWMQYVLYPETTIFEVVRYNLNFYHEMMPDGHLYERSFNWNANTRTRNNLRFGCGMDWGGGFYRNRPDDDEDYTVDDYPYRDNFGEFRPDKMAWYGRWLWFSSDDRKPIEVGAEIIQGTHREGKKLDGEIGIEVRPLPNLEFEAEVDWIRIEGASEIEDGERTDFVINRLKTRWSPTLDISIRGTIQFDKEDEYLGTNLLFAWNWNPGSWFYLVYDEGRHTDLRFQRDHWRPDERTIRMKWTYFFPVSL